MKKILLTLVLTQTQALLGWGTYTFYPPTFSADFEESFNNRIKQLEDEKREKQKRLDESNVFTDEDYNKLLEEKISDLKSINAILLRFEEDFRTMREKNSPNVLRTRDKAESIFKTNIWQYVHNKNLRYLVDHLRHDYRFHEVTRSEKLLHIKNKITTVKNKLLFLRDYCARKNDTPIRVFLFLWTADVALAIHTSHKDWDAHAKVLKELDEGFNQ